MQASLARQLSCSGTLCAQRISMKFGFDIGSKIRENCRANIIMSILNLKFSRRWIFKLWRVSWRHVVREMATVAVNVMHQSSFKYFSTVKMEIKIFLWNIGTYLPDHMLPYSWRPQCESVVSFEGLSWI